MWIKWVTGFFILCYVALLLPLAIQKNMFCFYYYSLFFCWTPLQVSTKWLSWLSEVTESHISHRNFSLEIRRKKHSQSVYFERNMFLGHFLAQKHYSVTETKSLWYNTISKRVTKAKNNNVWLLQQR